MSRIVKHAQAGSTDYQVFWGGGFDDSETPPPPQYEYERWPLVEDDDEWECAFPYEQ